MLTKNKFIIYVYINKKEWICAGAVQWGDPDDFFI